MELNLDMKVADIEYDRYVEDMELLIRKSMNKTASIKAITVTKNNGKVQRGIRVDEGVSNINPQIYLEEMYMNQKKKGATLGKAVSEFLEVYQSAKHESIPLGLFEWECAKRNITTRVINAEWNKELLDTIPHRKVLDLAIVYQIVMEISDVGFSTILINRNHMEKWGITEEELKSVAESNNERLLLPELRKLSDVICEILEMNDLESDEEDIMYVLTNQSRTFGAGTLFYNGMLEGLGNMLESDLIIIPSSIHEMVIMKAIDHEIDREEINALIKEVNREHVRVEDKLSDHCYYYSVANKQLSL